jgi:hypothetical protein
LLFGKRTDVRDANDASRTRRPTIAAAHESFDGICILTSNNRSRFDEVRAAWT